MKDLETLGCMRILSTTRGYFSQTVSCVGCQIRGRIVFQQILSSQPW